MCISDWLGEPYKRMLGVGGGGDPPASHPGRAVTLLVDFMLQKLEPSTGTNEPPGWIGPISFLGLFPFKLDVVGIGHDRNLLVTISDYGMLCVVNGNQRC